MKLVWAIKWWRVKFRKKNIHTRFVKILIISWVFGRAKLLEIWQNISEIIS